MKFHTQIVDGKPRIFFDVNGLLRSSWIAFFCLIPL